MQIKYIKLMKVPFFTAFIITLLNFIVQQSFFLATFKGFGGVSLEITKIGGIAYALFSWIPLLTFICIFVFRMYQRYKAKSSLTLFFIEIAGYAIGVCAAMLVIRLDLLYGLNRMLARMIELHGWVKYPVP